MLHFTNLVLCNVSHSQDKLLEVDVTIILTFQRGYVNCQRIQREWFAKVGLEFRAQKPGDTAVSPHFLLLCGSVWSCVFLSHMYILYTQFWKTHRPYFSRQSIDTAKQNRQSCPKIDNCCGGLEARWLHLFLTLLPWLSNCNYTCTFPTHGIPSVPLRFGVGCISFYNQGTGFCVSAGFAHLGTWSCQRGLSHPQPWVKDPSDLKCCVGSLRGTAVQINGPQPWVSNRIIWKAY